MKRLLRWLRRDKALERFLLTAARWQREAADWDRWQELERLAAWGPLNFSEALDLEMYRMQADLRRDLRRMMFGDKPSTKLEGLNAIMKAEYAPGMWRAMQEPSPLMKQLRRMDSE